MSTIYYYRSADFEGGVNTPIATGWVPPHDSAWKIELTLTTNAAGQTASSGSGVYETSPYPYNRCFIGVGADEDLLFGVGDDFDADYPSSPNTTYKLTMEYDGQGTATYSVDDTLYKSNTVVLQPLTGSFYLGAWNQDGTLTHPANYTIDSLLITSGAVSDLAITSIDESAAGSCEYMPGDVCTIQTGYTAQIEGGDATTSYLWSVGQGSIVSGQGTDSVVVESTASSNIDLTLTLIVADALGSVTGSETFTHTRTEMTSDLAITSIDETSAGSCEYAAGSTCPATSTYTAVIADPLGTVSYVWSVTGATIDSGQGTDTVTISTDADADTSFDLTLSVSDDNAGSDSMTETFSHTRTEAVVNNNVIYSMNTPFEGGVDTPIDTEWVPPHDSAWKIELTLTTNTDGTASSGSGVYENGQRCFLGVGAGEDLVFGLGNDYDADHGTTPGQQYELTMEYDGAGGVTYSIDGLVYQSYPVSFLGVTSSFYLGAWNDQGTLTKHVDYTIDSLLITSGEVSDLAITSIVESSAGSCEYTAGSTCPASSTHTAIITDPIGTVTYLWSVTGATITSGQGSDTVTVITDNTDANTSFTLTLEVSDDITSVTTIETFSHTRVVEIIQEGEMPLPTIPSNVLDYGLLGNGTTDDTAALNTLATNTSVTNWYFPSGSTFLLQSVHVPAHVEALYGGATIISKAYTPSDSPIGAFLLNRDNPQANSLIIDGLDFVQEVSSSWPPEANNTRWYGHITVWHNHSISDLEIRHCSFDTSEFDFNCIKVFGGPSGVNSGLRIYDNTFTNVQEFGLEIFNMQKTSDTRSVIDAQVYDNDFSSDAGTKQRAISIVGIRGGINNTGIPDGTETRVFNNTLHDLHWGIEVGNASGVQVYNNNITNISDNTLSLFSNGTLDMGVTTFYRNNIEGDHIVDTFFARLLIYLGSADVFHENRIDCGIQIESRGNTTGFDDLYFHDNILIQDLGTLSIPTIVKFQGADSGRFINNHLYGSSSVGRAFYLDASSGGSKIEISDNTMCMVGSAAQGIDNTGAAITESGNALTNSCSTAFPQSLPDSESLTPSVDLLHSNHQIDIGVMPIYDPNNSDMELIESPSQLGLLNTSSAHYFYLQPGVNYMPNSALTTVTASGTAQNRKYLLLNDGGTGHPGKLPENEQALIRLYMNGASFWTFHRLSAAHDNTLGNYIHWFQNGASDNITSMFHLWDFYQGMLVRHQCDRNVFQHCYIHDQTLNGRKADKPGISVTGNDWDEIGIINDVVVVASEFKNCNDGLQSIYPSSASPTRDYPGLIIADNHIWIDESLYVDGSGTPDINGSYAVAENGIDLKVMSSDPVKPVIISNNKVWGMRFSDPTASGLTDAGVGILTHDYTSNNHCILDGNIVFDCHRGMRIQSGHEVKRNIFAYNGIDGTTHTTYWDLINEAGSRNTHNIHHNTFVGHDTNTYYLLTNTMTDSQFDNNVAIAGSGVFGSLGSGSTADANHYYDVTGISGESSSVSHATVAQAHMADMIFEYDIYGPDPKTKTVPAVITTVSSPHNALAGSNIQTV